MKKKGNSTEETREFVKKTRKALPRAQWMLFPEGHPSQRHQYLQGQNMEHFRNLTMVSVARWGCGREGERPREGQRVRARRGKKKDKGKEGQKERQGRRKLTEKKPRHI